MERTSGEDVLSVSTVKARRSSMVDAKATVASPRVCVICGSVARYSYYGAVVCEACKVFFRRNGEIQPSPLKCLSDDHCEINLNNRRICSFCRLGKCFASGMDVQMFRSTRTKQKEKSVKKKFTRTSLRSSESDQPEQIHPLNLLRKDQSTLSSAQCNQLANLAQCFDENSGYSLIQRFVDGQNQLPPKFRFKHTSVNAFFTSMMSNVQLVFEKNRDYLSLSLHDRTFLLHNTVEFTTTFGGAFLLQQSHLLDLPNFSQSAEMIFQANTIISTKCLVDHLDSDLMLMKILFAIIAFFISNYTVYAHTTASHLNDTKAILRIQDAYTELAWRYLLYKYGERRAILCFSNLIRCLLLVNDCVVQSHEAREFTEIIDSVVQSTEETLTFSE